MNQLKEWIESIVQNWVYKHFSVHTLKAVLQKIVDGLEEKAKETDTFIDDWAIDALRTFIDSDEKVQIFYNYIKQFITPDTNDGTLKSAGIQDSELSAVAIQLGAKTGIVKGISLNALVELLKVVIPILIEVFTKKETTNDEATE